LKKEDNYDKNRAKVKQETFINKDKNLSKSKSKDTLLEDDKKDPSNYPSQVIIKLISIQGDELGSEMTIPIQTTTLDLNIMVNKIKNSEEKSSYIFLIDNAEIKSNILETLMKAPKFDSERIVRIVYRPESLFSVKPLTRASSTLEGHTDSILAVQFSADGEHLASGGGDCIVRFWDTFTETPMFNTDTEISHSNWVLCLSFSPCSSMLASGSMDGKFIIWNPSSGQPITRDIKAHSKWITSLAWKPLHLDQDCKFILTTSKDGCMKIWNIRTQHCQLSISAHEDSITKAIWGGENFIYTCSQDKSIKVWDETGICVQILKGHAHWINTMTINNEFIIRTGCFDEESRKIENFKSDRKCMFDYSVKRYAKFKEKINSSEKIVSGSDDFTLILWDPLNSNKPICRMTGHQGLVNHVSFSPDTFYLASASFDKSIKIWNGHTGEFLFNFRGHVGPVYQIAWSADSRLLLSGSKDSTLKCWNVKVKRLMYELPGHADEVFCVDWSPDGEKAVSGSKDRRLRIWKN
jgi:ribosome assembly protein 4